MPSSTFYNLPAEKRETLLAAARREFARVSYADASINRIIRDAGIPRGSFYMYFNDKQDIFQYILQGLGKRLTTLVIDCLDDSDGDLFPAFLMLYDRLQTLLETEQHEFSEIINLFKRNHGMSIHGLLEELQLKDFFFQISCHINKSLLDLQREEDLGDILIILLTAVGPSLIWTSDGSSTIHSRQTLANKLNILRRGMGKSPTVTNI